MSDRSNGHIIKRRRVTPEDGDTAAVVVDVTMTDAEATTTTTATSVPQDFHDRFSRQNAAFGAEVTAKLTKLKVIVAGLGGLGVETAKNLALQGVGALTLVDGTPTRIGDVGTNFFLKEQDAESGTPRAVAVAPRLRELNKFCDITANTEGLSDALVAAHDVIVVTSEAGLGRERLLHFDAYCRSITEKKVSFVYGFTGGVFGSVFVDHGEKHMVHDKTGERPIVKLLTGVSQEADGLVRYETPEGQPEGTISEGLFEITGVKGMTELNGKEFTLSHPDKDPAKTARLGVDTSGFGEYITGGLATEKKVAEPCPSKSLAAAFKEPPAPFTEEYVTTDLLKMGSELQTHVALQAVLRFRDQHDGRAPRPNDADDAQAVLTAAKALVAAGDVVLPEVFGEAAALDEEHVLAFARLAAVELQPMCTFLGGVLAQEVVKATGKFTPLPSFLHFHSLESLPKETPPADDLAPANSRYDNLIAAYGRAFVHRLGNLKYFMVGCGALGCESLKNFALNGICCGPEGRLTVTDGDRIELSNLCRQFLFREHNVRQSKSKAAGVAAREMNPGLKIDALEMYVGTKTEAHFNDAFWLGLDGVCNALDNMEARLYIDNACVKYEKPLLESGTMGTQGNVDPIVPFKTISYSDGGKAVEGGGVPMCTLRNFPHLPDHCIEWARDQFEALFVKLPKQAEAYVADPAAYEAEARASTDKTQTILGARQVLSFLRACRAEPAPTLAGCAQTAFDLFHMLFRDKIVDLTTTFPADARIRDSKTGADKGPFWHGHKKFPHPATYDPTNEAHWGFMVAATNLLAVALGVVPPRDEEDPTWCKDQRSAAWINAIVADLKVAEYVHAPVSTEGDDELQQGGEGKEGEGEEADDDAGAVLDRLLSELASAAAGGADAAAKLPSFELADFEKDDDLNFHIAFVTAATNLRSDNYSIARTDFQKAKLIAGRIIPAIATTTAAVTGLVVLELFKTLLEGKTTDDFMCRNINLATNVYTGFSMSEPKRFKTHTVREEPPADATPPEAYDEHGKVKPEYMLEETVVAYPEGHSKWDKLRLPSGDMSLDELKAWFEKEHGLTMTSWDFVIGTATYEDEDGKEKTRPVTTKVFPPPVKLNPALLPALDLGKAQAMTQIQKNKDIPGAAKMKYLTLWDKCKKAGSVEAATAADKATTATDEEVEASMSLRQILHAMSRRAAAAAASGQVSKPSIADDLDARKFWVVPANQVPSCRNADFDDVNHMAALHIPLA